MGFGVFFAFLFFVCVCVIAGIKPMLKSGIALFRKKNYIVSKNNLKQWQERSLLVFGHPRKGKYQI